MLIQCAVHALINMRRIMVIELRIIEVRMLRLAIRILIRLIIQEPHIRSVLHIALLVGRGAISRPSGVLCGVVGGSADRSSVPIQVVIGVPLAIVSRGEVVPRHNSRFSLEGACEGVSLDVSEVVGLERAKLGATVVTVAVLAGLILVPRQSAVVHVKIEHCVVVRPGIALTPAD